MDTPESILRPLVLQRKDSWTDDFRELINGGYIMLFIFGFTICLLAMTSLVAALFTDNPEKINMLSKIFDTIVGFLAGAYTTMWNNQHFKDQKKENGKSHDPKEDQPKQGV